MTPHASKEIQDTTDWLSHGFEFGSAAELIAVVVLAAAALASPPRLRALLGRWESRLFQPLLRLARHPTLSVAVCGLAPLALRAALWPVMGYPIQGETDEASYLLAADTFAHGRLTNPTHPLWRFFETFHIIQTPSYASKYPPLQGMALAAGQKLLGHPWWGVYLSVGLMSAALCWALRGWVPGRWALLGSFLALLQWEVLSYWMNSYWGGALAATGGALLLGGWPRLEISMRHKWKRAAVPALLMALGIAILANTRPYEGLLLTVSVLAALGRRAFRNSRRQPLDSGFRWRVFLPAAALLTITAGAMMYYFWRVTGKPWLMPYVVHDRQYAISPSFIFLPPRPEPQYRHPSLAGWWQWERGAYDMARSVRFPRYLLNRAYMIFIFYIGPALLIPYAALWLWKPPGSGHDISWLTGLLLFQFLAILMVAGTMPHYAAPSTALILLLAVIGLRRLQMWPHRRGIGTRIVPAWRQGWGAALVHVVVLVCMFRAALCVPAFKWISASHVQGSESSWRCCLDNHANFVRASLQKQLGSLPGLQLVVVQYGRVQPSFKEYVYNGADIDRQQVVWARSMGPQDNARLLHYYADRYAWLLTISAEGYALRPYPGAKAFENGAFWLGPQAFRGVFTK